MRTSGSGWRWGVAGPGGIAERFAEAMRVVDGGSIVAVASRSGDRASDYAARFGIPRTFDSYTALADEPDVDVVYVATPHALHLDHALLILEAGKHVLCEKPLTLNARQSQAMVDAARASGVFLMEAMWSRYLPSYRTMAELIGSGCIGDPLQVEADFGFRVPMMPEHRLFDPTLGGGALLDLGVYPIQLCTLLLGPVAAAHAVGRVGASGVDEQIAAVLRHERGGLGRIAAAIRLGTSCTARVSGTEGWIDVPAFMHCPEHLDVHTPAGHQHLEFPIEGDGMQFEIAEVHRCLDEGRLESDTMPLTESVALAAITDDIRSQLGVVYPADLNA